MLKRFGIGILTFLLASFWGYPTFAQSTLFSDTFTDISQVDTLKTSAWVDTANGWVELFQYPQTNVIDTTADENGNLKNVVVTTVDGVKWYTLDANTGQLVINPYQSVSTPNVLGISLVPESNDYFRFTDQGVQLVQFDGTGMVANPIMMVSGKSNLVTITTLDDKTVAAANMDGKIEVYTYDTETEKMVLNPGASFDTSLKDIVGVHHIPGTLNYMVTTRSGKSFQYVYDEATKTYAQNPVTTIDSGSQTVVSSDIATDGNLVSLLNPSYSDTYMMDQATGNMAQVNLLSVDPLNNAIAVSLPSDHTTVIGSMDGNVSTYQFDQATGQMVNNPSLQINGLLFRNSYRSPSVYQSIPIIPPSPNNMFQILPTEQNDPGSSITYSLSVDGGNTFVPVSPGAWVHLPAGTTNPPIGANVPAGPYIIQATLSSSANQSTPRLTDLTLNAYLDVTPPTTSGQPIGIQTMNGTDFVVNWAWSESMDEIQSPSTGASGVDHYRFRYSTDDGKTWSSWVNVGSDPSYSMSVPPNIAVTYHAQVQAVDVAGNISPPSSVGILFVDTYPLDIVPTVNGRELIVTSIIDPSEGQTYPTDIVPVRVKAGGEVIYQLTTKGGAKAVEVTYSDGQQATLVPLTDPNISDQTTWEGFYYPTGDMTIPLDTPQGTNIQITNIHVTGRDKPPYDSQSDLLVVDGSISRGNIEQMTPQISQ